MDQHWTQTEVDPTPEQWLALHHAFRRYCEAKPWERLANEDVLAVNDPLGHFKGYCVALGDGGVAYGLGVYLGDRGLLNYLTTMTSEDEPVDVEVLERGVALTAVLGDREELENAERKAMRDLGLRYRGRWPIFRSIIPGHWPWYVNADEARFLTIALDNVRDVAERIGQGMLDLYAGRAPSEVLTRRCVTASGGTSGSRCDRPCCRLKTIRRIRSGCSRSAGRRRSARRCGRWQRRIFPRERRTGEALDPTCPRWSW